LENRGGIGLKEMYLNILYIHHMHWHQSLILEYYLILEGIEVFPLGYHIRC